MKKKVVSILLSFMLVSALALSGCASGTNSDTSIAADTDNSTASGSGASALSAEKGEFTWLHHMAEQGKVDWVNYCANNYMGANPDVKINIEMVPDDDYITTLKTRIAADDAPMIFDIDRANTIDFQKAGHLATIDVSSDVQKNFSSDILKQGQIDGTQYGIPIDISAYGVYYNKDIFSKYGLEIPKTADELKKVCQTLLDNGVQPLGAPFGESWCQKHFCYAYTYIDCVENDSDWFSEKMLLKSTFSDDSQFKQAISDMASYKEYWGSDPFSTSWNEVLSGISTGKIAMTINGSWTITGILGINADTNIGTFALPVSNDPSQTQIRYEPGNNFCVYNSDNSGLLSAAKDFLNYMCSTESAEYYATQADTLTACNVDVKTTAAIDDIRAYTGNQIYNMIAITEFNNEYLTDFNDVTTQYLQKSEFDVDSYAKALDDAFTAIK